MKKLIFISVIFAFASLKTATAQNTRNIVDSTHFKNENCFTVNSQLLAYCQDTSKTQSAAHKGSREILEAKKRDYFTKEMHLTEDEAKVFFPVLNQFESKQRKIGHERKKLFETFEAKKNTITDAEARQINKQFLELKKQEFDLITEYQTIFETILSPKKMLLFYKTHENFMRGLLKSMGTKSKDEDFNPFPKNKIM